MKYLRTRLDFENEDRESKAPFAVHPQNSRGRVHPEEEHPYRTCFQRDRDRVVHSAAFRRLEAKTQVFFSPQSDYYRTRLTHTIEVTQIARTMARCLGVNEDLAEAIALAHDLGHPPYGHVGEHILDELMADHGGFEHNRQSLRVVDFLEHPYPAFCGLNLCFETRQCLAKHETRYDQTAINAQFGEGFAPLEGQIADLADAVAYHSHDLDDALAAELITEADLKEVSLYQAMVREVEHQYSDMHVFARQLRCAKGLIDLLIKDAMLETSVRLTRLEPKSVDDIRNADTKLVCLSDTRQQQLDKLGDFLLERVYRHRRYEQDRADAKRDLTFLFEMFIKDPARLPDRYRKRIDDQGLHCVICDYLAGMTDRFCRQLYLDHSSK